MATVRGAEGAVIVGSDIAAEITGHTFNSVLELADITALGDTDRRKTYTLRDTNGNIEGHYDSTDPAQTALFAQIASGSTPTSVTLVLLDDNTTGSKSGWTGTAWLTNISRTVRADGIQAFTANAEYTGGVTAYST